MDANVLAAPQININFNLPPLPLTTGDIPGGHGLGLGSIGGGAAESSQGGGAPQTSGDGQPSSAAIEAPLSAQEVQDKLASSSLMMIQRLLSGLGGGGSGSSGLTGAEPLAGPALIAQMQSLPSNIDIHLGGFLRQVQQGQQGPT